MGVSGLLPQLKPIQNPVSLARYLGETLAIDGYAWLHRSAHSCAMELAMDQPTDKYLQFFIKRISMLRHFKITPFFVFDGDSIQVKKETELKRAEKRKENREKAHALFEAGDRRLAYDYFQKCVSITPDMAKCVIEYLQMNSIPYVVAPYEADAQMVYLEKQGLVQGIISEDSDLLVFGCTRLITKLNDNAECIEIDRRNFERLNEGKFPLSKLTEDQLRSLVCLSGCDYTSGIPKVGLVTAMKYVVKNRTMEQMIMAIKREGKLSVPHTFWEEYQYANFAFQFQRVWCPLNERLVTLNAIPNELLNNEKLFNCIGHAIHKEWKIKDVIFDFEDVDHHLHKRISLGELNPYDFNKPLVNREHKLRLKSQSVVMTIDKFCTAKTTAGSSANSKSMNAFIARKSQSLNNGSGIMSKLETALKRRKLSGPANEHSTKKVVNSQFFAAKREPKAVPKVEPKPEPGLAYSAAFHSDTFSDVMLLDSDEESETQTGEQQKKEPSQKLSQEDVETEVPSSLVPSSEPDSSFNEKEKKDALSMAEEESEVLSEVEEKEKTEEEDLQKKQDNQILAALRNKFLHTGGLTENIETSKNRPKERVPLKNVTNIMRVTSTKTKIPEISSQPIPKPIPTPRPARRTMSGAMTAMQSSVARSESSGFSSGSTSSTISLSQFAYSRK